nr:hypothetical protein BaRGS_018801 [Batillaria attramentaria]
MPEVAVLAEISQMMVTGLRDFRANVSGYVQAGASCMVRQLGPTVARVYGSEISIVHDMYKQVADAFVTFGDRAMAAITQKTCVAMGREREPPDVICHDY